MLTPACQLSRDTFSRPVLQFAKRSPTQEPQRKLIRRQIQEVAGSLAARELPRSYRDMPQKTKRPSREIETAAKTIIPCLWFDRQAEEAARFYVSIFPDSHVDKVVEAPADSPSGKKG